MKSNYPFYRRAMPFMVSLFAFILCFAFTTNATTYYISPSGNDATGTGTSANPWKTLYKATSAVSTSGDIIFVTAGTYVETQQSSLAIGVSIQGVDSTTSIIKSTLSADWTAIISAKSATEATNGNQHISNLKFDGQNLTTAWAIIMAGRKNYSIYNCSFANFRQSACIFAGRADNQDIAPNTYATGNSFYNNIVNNCATYSGYGLGCLMIGGQDGMLIYNNTITQNSRAAGTNGWPIKYFNNGYIKGCKIYNNILTKNPLMNSLGNGDWDFAIEFFNEQGLEIYGNTITGGGIDLNYQTKGSYAYSVWIHDNTIKMPTLNTYLQHGITLEFDTQDAIIENNSIDKMNTGILFTPRDGSYVQNIAIRRNLITNGGFGEGTGFHITFSGGATQYFNNIDIFNNTMVMDVTNKTWFGIRLPEATGGYIKNIHIKNNIIANSLTAGIVQQGGTIAIDSLNIDNNDTYGNGNSDNPSFAFTPTHYTYTNNQHVTPMFVGSNNYTLQSVSPLVDAGTYVGLSYTGNAPDKGYAELNTILPVKLINFTATENKGKNLLQWQTATESNGDRFSVERSSNGVDFEEIGSVKAVGNSSTIINYSFTDAVPLAGINYYRLVMIDKDASKLNSNTVSVTNKNAQALTIVTAQLPINKNSMALTVSSSQNQKALLSLFDINGRIYLNQSVQLQKGTTVINQNTGVLSNGIYYIKLSTSDETVVKNVFGN